MTVLFALTAAIGSCGPTLPPVAKRVPVTTTTHGDARVDPYGWLRNREDPDVLRYLNAENAYAERAMSPTRGLQDALFREMRARLKEDDSSAPYRKGEYFYYTRTEKGKEYGIRCRKHRSLEAPEQIVLDVNALAEGEDYMSVDPVEASPDNRMLAYVVDTTGNDRGMGKGRPLGGNNTA